MTWKIYIVPIIFISFLKKFFRLIDCYVGSSFLCQGFLQLWQAGATLHCGARASHYRGLSCCGAQAPGAQAQQLWLTGLVAPRHVGSSQTRARTRVPCISRQILNHCATREAPIFISLTHIVKHILNQHLELINICIFPLNKMRILARFYFSRLPPSQISYLSTPCYHLSFQLIIISKDIYLDLKINLSQRRAEL